MLFIRFGVSIKGETHGLREGGITILCVSVMEDSTRLFSLVEGIIMV